MNQSKKVFLLELNEFNLELLQTCTKLFHLKNLEKVLGYSKTKIYTEDRYESDFLEPWVQWVSIHTGLSSKEHKIKHLGDVPHLDSPQIWQVLGEKGVTSAVWGAMNASKAVETCQIFLPDPWTFSETAYPNAINDLLEPLRYLSKNYLDRQPKVMIQKAKNLFRFFKEKNLLKDFLKTIFSMGYYSLKFKMEHFPFICLLEKLSVELFLTYKKETQPGFSLLFINSLAHLQHHHWKDFDYQSNPKLRFGLQNLDHMIGKILEALEDNEILLVTNGLSQKNTNDESPWILYRQFNHAEFLEKIGIHAEKIEPHMTHDAHLFFNSVEEKEEAKKILEKILVKDKPLFFVEEYKEDLKKLFYKIVFTDDLEDQATFICKGQVLPFFEYFKKVVKRTGRHIQEGVLFSSEPLSKEFMMNHEIFNHIIGLFSV
jgi:hypothetical protein